MPPALLVLSMQGAFWFWKTLSVKSTIWRKKKEECTQNWSTGIAHSTVQFHRKKVNCACITFINRKFHWYFYKGAFTITQLVCISKVICWLVCFVYLFFLERNKIQKKRKERNDPGDNLPGSLEVCSKNLQKA